MLNSVYFLKFSIFQMLPKEVIAQLKSNEKYQAKFYKEATVFFSTVDSFAKYVSVSFKTYLGAKIQLCHVKYPTSMHLSKHVQFLVGHVSRK